MLPTSKTNTTEWKNFKVFFDAQYPNTEDCAELNKHIADINSDLNLLRALKLKKEGYDQKVREWFDNCLAYLKTILKSKENTYKFSCANYVATNPGVSNLDQNIGNVETPTSQTSTTNNTTENTENTSGLTTNMASSVNALKSKVNMTYVYIGIGLLVVSGFVIYKLKK